MEPSFSSFVELLQNGGNLALVVACYFIYRAERRLWRIEKAIEVFLRVFDEPTILRQKLRDLRTMSEDELPEG